MSRFASSSGNNNENLLALIQLMSSPDQFKDRLAQLVELEKELDEKIALAGVAEEIITIRQSLADQQTELGIQAEETKANQRAILQEAKDKAKGIVEKANLQAEQTIANANQQLKDAHDYALRVKAEADDECHRAEEQAQSLRLELHEQSTELTKKSTDLDAREQEVKEQEAKIDSQWALIDQAIADLERRSKRIETLELQVADVLKGAMSGFRAMQKDLK